MLNHFGHSFRKGDTLIEVMFAVGVFGLAAVGAISLMNRGLATAQNTLEVTMARQEIDGQAEILRFLHSAYMSSKDPISSNPCGNPQSYRDLWKCITTNYVYKPGNSSGGVEGIDDVDKDFYGRTVTPGDHCDTLFHANGKNDQFSIPDKSFVLNYRNLGSADVNNATLGSVISSYTLVHTAGTYPRLIFTNSTVDCETEENKDRPECTLSDATITTNAASMQKQLQAAEGIWVTAVASNAGVQCEGEANPRPDFYDFHIQTCWESVAGNTASTISSTVRLFNPDQVQPVKKTTDAGTVNVSVESACVRHSYSPEPEPEPTPTPEPEPTPTPESEPEEIIDIPVSTSDAVGLAIEVENGLLSDWSWAPMTNLWTGYKVWPYNYQPGGSSNITYNGQTVMGFGANLLYLGHANTYSNNFVLYYGEPDPKDASTLTQYTRKWDSTTLSKLGTFYIHTCHLNDPSAMFSASQYDKCFFSSGGYSTNDWSKNYVHRTNNIQFSFSAASAKIESSSPKYWVIGKGIFTGNRFSSGTIKFTKINVITDKAPSTYLDS